MDDLCALSRFTLIMTAHTRKKEEKKYEGLEFKSRSFCAEYISYLLAYKLRMNMVDKRLVGKIASKVTQEDLIVYRGMAFSSLEERESLIKDMLTLCSG
jgi:hypothetical protein